MGTPPPPWEAIPRDLPAESRLHALAGELLRRCRGEGPPNCTAGCPLAVDGRRYARLAAEGKFTEALRVVRERLPFPGILAFVCSSPCEWHCKRIDEDSPVRLRDIKRFLVEHEDGKPAHLIRVAADRGRAVVVVGGGPAGLMAAHDLRREGYDVTLLDREQQLGGNLVSAIPEWRLPRRIVERDLSVLPALGVHVRLGTALGRDVSLAQLQREFDAVVLCIGFAGLREVLAAAPLPQTPRGTLAVLDPARVAETAGIFAAGDAVSGPGTVVDAMAAGRLAAEAVHSYLNPARRRPEAPCRAQVMRWPLEVSEDERRRRVPSPDMMAPAPEPLLEAEVRAEAQRCLDCHCRICVDECEFLSHYCRSPQEIGRRLQEDLTSARRMIYSCALCGLCSRVCPEHLSIGEVLLEARRELVREGLGPLPEHQRLVESYRQSVSSPLTLAVPAAGRNRSRRVFLPGCGLAAASPRVTVRTFQALREAYPELGVLMYCCGAPVLCLGMDEEFHRGQEGLLRLVEGLHAEEILAACPDCARVLREHLPEVRVTPAWVQLAAMGRSWESRRGARVAVQDPCQARGDGDLQHAVRALIAASGAEVVELAHARERTLCCGRGGGLGLADPALSQRMTHRRMAETEEVFLTACAGCRRVLGGSGAPAIHLMDFLTSARWRKHASSPPPRRLRAYANRHLARLLLRRRAMTARPGREPA